MGDTIVLNGVTYVSLERANQMVRDALDTSMPEQEWLTVAQAAQLAGRGERTLYDAIRQGRLDARTPNGLRRGMRIRRGDLMQWMEGQRTHD